MSRRASDTSDTSDIGTGCPLLRIEGGHWADSAVHSCSPERRLLSSSAPYTELVIVSGAGPYVSQWDRRRCSMPRCCVEVIARLPFTHRCAPSRCMSNHICNGVTCAEGLDIWPSSEKMGSWPQNLAHGSISSRTKLRTLPQSLHPDADQYNSRSWYTAHNTALQRTHRAHGGGWSPGCLPYICPPVPGECGEYGQ